MDEEARKLETKVICVSDVALDDFDTGAADKEGGGNGIWVFGVELQCEEFQA